MMHQCWFIVDKHERWHRAEPVYWDEHMAGHLRTLLPGLDRTYPDRAPHRVVHMAEINPGTTPEKEKARQ